MANLMSHPKSQPRVPLQERSVVRYNTLLDALEMMLRDKDPDDLGLAQISEASGIPIASVYHFFPTKEAAFTGLVQRHLEGVAGMSAEPFEASRLRSWQDLMAVEHEYGRGYHMRNPVATKLFYGCHGSLEGRKLDNAFMFEFAGAMFSRYDAVFHMPFVADPVTKFHICLSIMDMVWGLSFLRQGHITQVYADEALAASIAYGRSFLPDRVEVREHVKQLAEAGRTICVPILGEPGVPGDVQGMPLRAPEVKSDECQ
jgi:AcrR family transcriptional regulator